MSIKINSRPSLSSMNQDSRKRPLDHDCDNGLAKRSHFNSDGQGEAPHHLKILVPSVAAGGIIGKGGETIAQLQKDTGARIKMSKANDYYPGTSERVCLITGNAPSILSVLAFIFEKQKPDSKTEFDRSTDRDHHIKILVPNSTAGMIIGKGGAYIKQIKEESHAYVQISQKAKDQSLAERCITISSSDLEDCKNACAMVVRKIVEDPQSGTCLNISYADVNGPVANPNPIGSPFATLSHHHNNNNNNSNNNIKNNSLSTVGGLGNLLGGGVNLTLNLSSAYPGGGVGNPMVTGQLLEHVRSQLRSSGFNDHSNAEVCQAISTLINYGIIGLGLGLNNPNLQGQGPNMGGNALLGNNMAGCYVDCHSDGMSNRNSGPFGPIGTTVASGVGHGNVGPQKHDRYNYEGVYHPHRRQNNELGGGLLPLNSNSFGLGTALGKNSGPGDLSENGETKKLEMEVGENIIGAIIGPGGKTLVEIQRISSTSIQISKKGSYAPGTQNRIVTINGSSSGISAAKCLIEQRISEEDSKRTRQSSHTLQ